MPVVLLNNINFLSLCARELGIEKKSLIVFLTKPENWNPDGFPYESPPSPASLYKGGRKNRTDAARIRAGIRKYAQENNLSIICLDQLDADMTILSALEFQKRYGTADRPVAARRKGSVNYVGYVYCLMSAFLADDCGRPGTKLAYGYFFVRQETLRRDLPPKMNVESGEAWYLSPNDPLFLPDNKRGEWDSQYVGISAKDVLIVYELKFDPAIHESTSYKGLLAVDLETGRKAAFGHIGPVYSGEFYTLVLPETKGGKPQTQKNVERRNGRFYIEKIGDYTQEEFQSGDCVDILRGAIAENADEIQKVF